MTKYVRINTDCGNNNNVINGRAPCQLGWYNWCGKKYCVGKTVLDVGCGMCDGMDILKKCGASEVTGQDVDIQLKTINKDLLIMDVKNIADKSYDIITCFDVIEHVLDDTVFFNNLIRIAKELVIITTPNFTRSAAANVYHCREYTIPQFVNIFKPDELWTASPDGKIHNTLLLKKQLKSIDSDNNIYYNDNTRNDIIYTVPLDYNLSFTHSTVDGKEWPHICGIFNINC